MTEAALDSLFKRFYHVDSGCEPQHQDGRFPRLSYIEQIVKQGLAGVRGE